MIRGILRRRHERLAAVRHAAHVQAQLRESTDIAITAARRKLSGRMPLLPLQEQAQDRERVDVAHVLALAYEYFGLTGIPRKQAAEVLRARYELRSGAMDLDTDAYDVP
ncbi:hypothetical protein [Streptomyces sp. NPDC004592]